MSFFVPVWDTKSEYERGYDDDCMVRAPGRDRIRAKRHARLIPAAKP